MITINVLKFPDGEQVLYGDNREHYYVLMPGERFTLYIEARYVYRIMKMNFVTYKRRYLDD